MPSVKKTYKKLNPKGFEIIGISLDTKESALKRFIEKENMPWPQFFDGKGWSNGLAKKHGIRSIPAMWLVDKQGNLVDLNARANLEQKVEDLLGAPLAQGEVILERTGRTKRRRRFLDCWIGCNRAHRTGNR